MDDGVAGVFQCLSRQLRYSSSCLENSANLALVNTLGF